MEIFGIHQQATIGTIRKLMYTNDMQTSLNIQDELDKEWVSLFGRIDDRTGQYIANQSYPVKETTGE